MCGTKITAQPWTHGLMAPCDRQLAAQDSDAMTIQLLISSRAYETRRWMLNEGYC